MGLKGPLSSRPAIFHERFRRVGRIEEPSAASSRMIARPSLGLIYQIQPIRLILEIGEVPQ
jgi:hypothetical protein